MATKATCKTCGGEVPDGHIPTSLDGNGVGHPDHKVPMFPFQSIDLPPPPAPVFHSNVYPPADSPLEDKEDNPFQEVLDIVDPYLNTDAIYDRDGFEDFMVQMNNYIEKERIKARIAELNDHRSLITSHKGGISETKDDVDWRIEDLENQLNKIEGK